MLLPLPRLEDLVGIASEGGTSDCRDRTNRENRYWLPYSAACRAIGLFGCVVQLA